MGPSASRSRTTSGIRRIVIVADNSLIVETIRIAFRNSGEFKLVGHADCRKTSAKTIVDTNPDVILIDDMDRSESGLELMRAIRAEDDHVSIIVLSVQMDPDWLSTAFDAGAVGVISKAAHPLALATLVRETLNGHIYHQVSRPSAASRAQTPMSLSEDYPLTRRELEILQLVASGSTNGEVARELWVTEQTVKFHLRNIYRKLGVANRTQASHFAYVNGLGDSVTKEALAGPECAAVAS